MQNVCYMFSGYLLGKCFWKKVLPTLYLGPQQSEEFIFKTIHYILPSVVWMVKRLATYEKSERSMGFRSNIATTEIPFPNAAAQHSSCP